LLLRSGRGISGRLRRYDAGGDGEETRDGTEPKEGGEVPFGPRGIHAPSVPVGGQVWFAEEG
jgi:hypothetical protein